MRYKQKVKILLWSFVPILFILYLLVFKETINLVYSYKHSLASFQSKTRKKDSNLFMDSKINAINTWKRQYILDSTMTEKNIITKINFRCEELGLIFNEYRPLKLSRENVWTRFINVAGDFHSLLQLMYRLEQIDKVCRIACVIFQKPKEAGLMPESLSCTIYVQNLLEKK